MGTDTEKLRSLMTFLLAAREELSSHPSGLLKIYMTYEEWEILLSLPHTEWTAILQKREGKSRFYRIKLKDTGNLIRLESQALMSLLYQFGSALRHNQAFMATYLQGYARQVWSRMEVRVEEIETQWKRKQAQEAVEASLALPLPPLPVRTVSLWANLRQAWKNLWKRMPAVRQI